MIALRADVGSAIVMSLMVPFSCIPAGSLNVTSICRPINWFAMMGYGSLAGILKMGLAVCPAWFACGRGIQDARASERGLLTKSRKVIKE